VTRDERYFAKKGIEREKGRNEPLNSLTKSIDLTPRAPNAGPTGGAAVAFPAGTTSLGDERTGNKDEFDEKEERRFGRELDVPDDLCCCCCRVL